MEAGSELFLFLLAMGGGIAPALVWLWFFLKEDAHPEPRSLILLAFVGGMLSVAPAIALEQAVLPFTSNEATFLTVATLFAWATIEELVKWFAMWALVLWRKAVDEPIDIPIYLITGALGFAAAENALFLLAPLQEGLGAVALMQGGMRFLGATLLHVLASGIFGVALAYTVSKPRPLQRLGWWGGVVSAVGVHFFFNLAILRFTAVPPLVGFVGVWALVVLLLAALERVKRTPLINRNTPSLRRTPVVYS